MVTHIKKGDGTVDYAQDLSDIALLAERNIQKLKDAGCNLIHLERLNEYRYKYDELVAQCAVEEEDRLFVSRNR